LGNACKMCPGLGLMASHSQGYSEENVKKVSQMKSEIADQKDLLEKIRIKYNDNYGTRDVPEPVTLIVEDQYENMKEVLDKRPEVMGYAREAMQNAGMDPVTKPIRGGTDGSRLSLLGLPCPNISAGGHNFHSVREYVPRESMEKAVEVIVNLAQLPAQEALTKAGQ